MIRIASLSNEERTSAVAAFDQRYGEMERVLACLARHAREDLLVGRVSAVVEVLTWTIKSWWAIQGVRREAKHQLAQALAEMEWSEAAFGPADVAPNAAADWAYGRVVELVRRSMALGVPRREFSFASKILFWVSPSRVPVYDSFVRKAAGIPNTWDHPRAYEKLARVLFHEADALREKDPVWLGTLEPRSMLRGMDKILWWLGGGAEQAAVVAKDPWAVVRALGLPNRS